MFLFKLNNGTIVEAYEGFNPSNPDWEKLTNVAKVMQVSKVFEKQVKLSMRPLEERKSIRQKAAEEEAGNDDLDEPIHKEPPADAPKTKRKRK